MRSTPTIARAGPWVRFDIPRFTLHRRCEHQVGRRGRGCGGWTIVPDEQIALRLVRRAERGRTAASSGCASASTAISIRRRPATPSCQRPPGKPQRVLVGHYYGCSLFELDAGPREAERANGLRRVAAIEAVRRPRCGGERNRRRQARQSGSSPPAPTRRWPAGASWTGRPSPRSAAAFEVKGGKLVVTAIDVGSPAWEGGLTEGDVIDVLAVDGRKVYDGRPGKSAIGTAEERGEGAGESAIGHRTLLRLDRRARATAPRRRGSSSGRCGSGSRLSTSAAGSPIR